MIYILAQARDRPMQDRFCGIVLLQLHSRKPHNFGWRFISEGSRVVRTKWNSKLPHLDYDLSCASCSLTYDCPWAFTTGRGGRGAASISTFTSKSSRAQLQRPSRSNHYRTCLSHSGALGNVPCCHPMRSSYIPSATLT